MRYIWVDESPLVRFTLQSNVVSVTSKAVSQIFVNSEIQHKPGSGLQWDVGETYRQ